MSRAAETIACPHCGLDYEYDDQRRCWRCDGETCPHCLPDDAPLCPECRFGPLPIHLSPMLAVPGDMPGDPAHWAFEYKWDGMRALCYWQSGKMRLESRNLREITGTYPELKAAPDRMPETGAIFDGEIVAFDGDGRPSFKQLQRRIHLSPKNAVRMAETVPTTYYVFDLLWLGDRSLADAPYRDRRKRLADLDLASDRWRVPPSHMGEGAAMIRVARRWGLEGVMAKRADAPYRSGVRSRDWRKIKIVRRQEFVVGGWEPRKANPDQVGSLLVGYHDPDQAALQYAGRVGTGFDANAHETLLEKLKSRERSENPFDRRVGGRGARFVSPDLVAEVAYRRWPRDGDLQQAAFLGLRTDVAAHEVVIGRGD